MKKVHQEARIENVYQLEGRVPVGKAIPFGLQHVLAMFVANIAPLIIIASVAVYNGQVFTTIETAQLLQNCMLIAGIGTLIQLYPIWKIGSGLPVVMGLSFTFLAACMSAASQDYGIMVGSIIVGGIFEGILGLTAKYWRRIISPVLSSCVVIAIGLSILNVGVSSFGSSSAYPLGSWQNLLVATITLTAALVFHTTLKGVAKQLYVLLGMLVGYVVSIFFGMVDFASMGQTIQSLGVVAIPKLFAFKPQFQLGSILSFALVFIVSAVETIGDTTATCTGGLGRDITAEEVSGIPASWPRVDLSVGSTGEKVRQIQEQLARISRSYPAIPTITPDGIYGPETREAVERFQSIFGLPVTGVIDFRTWYRISEIYVAVTRIAELV